MSAQIIQFVPRPRKTVPILTPLDFAIWHAETTADWLKTLNDFADTTPTDTPKDSA